jgi:hypothetical protein
LQNYDFIQEKRFRAAMLPAITAIKRIAINMNKKGEVMAAKAFSLLV